MAFCTRCGNTVNEDDRFCSKCGKDLYPNSNESFSKEGMVEYLTMLQEPISRMSTGSAIFKGFAATIVAGVALIPYDTINTWVLIASCLPVLVFALLDVYYLILERKYRFLFNQVRKGEHPIDYSLELTKDPVETIRAKARFWDCLKSPSIWLFYPMLLLILAGVVVLRIKGVI